MALGLFNALFNISGNAVPELQKIQLASNALIGTSSGLVNNLSFMAAALGDVSKRATGSIAPVLSLQKSLITMAETGNITSNSLLNLARTATITGSRFQNELNPSLRMMSQELQRMSAQVKLSEGQLRQASMSGGFKMMGDVSVATATKFKQISAGAQGMMLAMSLLQRNVMGLAFSLIFLQFTGFLRLSLFVAGTIGLLGGAAIAMKKLISEGLSMDRISNAFLVLSGSAEQAGLALSAAEEIGRKFGLSRELLDGLLLLRKDGLRPTNDQLEDLRQAFTLLQQGVLPSTIKTTEDVIAAFSELLETGKDVDGLFTGLADSASEWSRRSRDADKLSLKDTRTELQKTKESFGRVFGPTAKVIAQWWTNLQRNFIELGKAIFSKNIIGVFRALIWDPTVNAIRIGAIVLKALLKDIIFLPILNNFKQWGRGISKAFSFIINDLISLTRTLGKLVLSGFKNNILNPVINFVKNSATDMFTAGSDIVIGLWNGIKSMSSWLFDNTFNFAKDIFKSIKDGMGILWFGSPSVAGVKIGQGLGLGIIKGIKGITPAVNSATSLLSQNITGNTLTRGLSNINPSSNQVNSRSITIIVQNNNFGNNDPRRAGKTIAGEIISSITRNSTISTAPLVP